MVHYNQIKKHKKRIAEEKITNKNARIKWEKITKKNTRIAEKKITKNNARIKGEKITKKNTRIAEETIEKEKDEKQGAIIPVQATQDSNKKITGVMNKNTPDRIQPAEQGNEMPKIEKITKFVKQENKMLEIEEIKELTKQYEDRVIIHSTKPKNEGESYAKLAQKLAMIRAFVNNSIVDRSKVHYNYIHLCNQILDFFKAIKDHQQEYNRKITNEEILYIHQNIAECLLFYINKQTTEEGKAVILMYTDELLLRNKDAMMLVSGDVLRLEMLIDKKIQNTCRSFVEPTITYLFKTLQVLEHQNQETLFTLDSPIGVGAGSKLDSPIGVRARSTLNSPILEDQNQEKPPTLDSPIGGKVPTMEQKKQESFMRKAFNSLKKWLKGIKLSDRLSSLGLGIFKIFSRSTMEKEIQKNDPNASKEMVTDFLKPICIRQSITDDDRPNRKRKVSFDDVPASRSIESTRRKFSSRRKKPVSLMFNYKSSTQQSSNKKRRRNNGLH